MVTVWSSSDAGVAVVAFAVIVVVIVVVVAADMITSACVAFDVKSCSVWS